VKINVEVDCTPEEARQFLGLPDVAPMQHAVMEKLKESALRAVDATAPEALLKTWFPGAPDQMQQAFAKMFGAFGAKSPGEKP
jgi:hypothetical protein